MSTLNPTNINSNPPPAYSPPSSDLFEVQNKGKAHQIAQRSLLMAAVACSILSIIPPLRFAGSLALRGVALLSSSASLTSQWSEQDLLGKLTKVAKVAGVALGLVGLAIALPALMVASIGVDLGVQVFEASKAIHEGNYGQAVIHLGLMIVDTLLLAGIVAGSWELIVASISVNIALMTSAVIITLSNMKGDEEIIDAVCYAALAATGIATAFTTAEITRTGGYKAQFSGKNSSDKEMLIFDKDHQLIASVPSGENYDFTLDTRGLVLSEYVDVVNAGNGFRLAPTGIIAPPNLQNSLAPKLFPTLPVGGPSYNIPLKV